MSLLPELRRCPCCDTVNFVRNSGNAIEQDNSFKNLKNWKLIKKFICRKCKEELGFFSNNSSLKSETKLIWLNNLNIEENYFNKLNVLERRKNKLAKTQDHKYFEILKNIEDIQEKIRLDKIKLKIKLKIQKRF